MNTPLDTTQLATGTANAGTTLTKSQLTFLLACAFIHGAQRSKTLGTSNLTEIAKDYSSSLASGSEEILKLAGIE